MTDFFARALESAEFLRFEPHEFIPGASTVLVQGWEQVRVRQWLPMGDGMGARVHTARQEERSWKMREYYDTAVMVAAFRGER